MLKTILRRVTVWICFGLILTLVPLGIVAFIKLPAIPSLGAFLDAASNEDLLAVAFTLAAAAASDVLVPKPNQAVGEWRVLAGSITIVFAIFSAMLYVVVKTHSYKIPDGEVVPATQIVYAIAMLCSLACEILAET